MRKRSEVVTEEKPTIEEVSEPLTKRLSEAENTEDPMFGPIPRIRPIPTSFDRVVTKVFLAEDDFEKSYDKLMTLLRSLEGKSEKAFQRDALTRAPEGHQLACRLLATAKRILTNWEADNAVRHGLMRERGHRSLEAEKDGGGRRKAITDGDCNDRAALLFPEDWKSDMREKSQYSLMVKNLETVVDSFNHFNNGLRSLVGSG